MLLIYLFVFSINYAEFFHNIVFRKPLYIDSDKNGLVFILNTTINRPALVFMNKGQQ